MTTQKFSRHERLKSQKKIQQLFESGKQFYHYPFRIIWKTEEQYNPEVPAQIAISVSKRNLKKAVERNLVKRKIREAYRKNKCLLYRELDRVEKGVFFMVIFNTSLSDNDISIDNELVNALKKLSGQIIYQNG
ncbi:MAG: ribonuclease P protein component [Bacteroidales bacterium]|jgi:ribonuclease P protein component|nr:ribonuclease P protein component [Bacteroidales bacterium]